MRIKEVKTYRFEATQDEVKSISAMFQFYEDNAEDDDDGLTAVRRAFGIKARQTTEQPELFDREETLPEKALRVSAGRRKSRVSPDE